jgi:hypothetical protein
MALRQRLTDIGTEYRNLQFGKDRPGGGDSKHPFVTKDLPAVDSAPTDTFPDFILRDPKNQLENRKDDLIRISKFLKSREGGLFIAKQELLSLQNPLTPGRPNRSNPVAGLYNPLMTLAQVAGAGTGLHIEKQGLFPILSDDEKYNSVYRNLSLDNDNNRLSLLYNLKISGSSDAIQTVNAVKYGIALSDNFILSYTGGPDSYGVGRTRIPFSADRLTTEDLEDKTDESLKESINKTANYDKSIISKLGLSEKYLNPDQELDTTLTNKNNITIGSYVDDLLGINDQGILVRGAQLRSSQNIKFLRDPRDANPQINAALSQSFNRTALPLTADDIIRITKNGASQKSTSLNYIKITTEKGGTNDTDFFGQNSVYTLGNTFPEQNPKNTTDLGVYTLNQTQISNRTSLGPLFLSNPSDFRSEVINTNPDSGLYSFDYTSHKVDIKYRIGMGNPGNRIRKRDREALATSSNTGSLSSNSVWSTVDKVNYQKMYKQLDGESLIINNISAKADDNTGRDLVAFYFSVIDNDNPTEATYVHFRAFIGNIRDNYDAEYNTTKYIGRGEKFYNYSGFDRQITIDFKVAPQTALEMKPLHQKLNYLASLTAPDYSTGKGNFMRSNLTKLWLGEYFYGIPGFIRNVSYDITEDSTWEINFDQPEGGIAGGKNNLLTGPRLWNVSITFVPIHNFAPRLVDINDQRKTAFFTPDSTYSSKINPYLPGVTGTVA